MKYRMRCEQEVLDANGVRQWKPITLEFLVDNAGDIRWIGQNAPEPEVAGTADLTPVADSPAETKEK